ncbi:MAG: FtsK/SpoIIIE domain-containing protein [Candidatus Cryptobacteroides sp.]
METNNYPIGLLGGHPELLHCVGEKELQRKKSLIQTALEEEGISGPLEAEVLPQCTVFRVSLNGTDERTSIRQLKGTLSETIGRPVRIIPEESGGNKVMIEVLNDEPSGVPLRGVLQSPQFRRCTSSLPLALGLGTDFKPEVLDLDTVPEIVMTGQDNAELPTMMNVFIASLLYAVPRDTVRMMLMDLNGDGLSVWKGVSGVEYVYGDKEVCTVLRNLTNEQMERGGAYIRKTVVFISGFDEKVDSGEGLSDLLKQLHGQGCHSGYHFIVSDTSIDCTFNEAQMERDTVRILFRQTASESQNSPATHLGTDVLSGKGDFLLCKDRRTKRIQGPMVTPEECGKIVDYLRSSN